MPQIYSSTVKELALKHIPCLKNFNVQIVNKNTFSIPLEPALFLFTILSFYLHLFLVVYVPELDKWNFNLFLICFIEVYCILKLYILLQEFFVTHVAIIRKFTAIDQINSIIYSDVNMYKVKLVHKKINWCGQRDREIDN